MKSILTWNLCLRGLSHPIILLNIILLLINDHVLKIYYPSFITGKLSDFTGLFFFPFLFAAMISLPLERIGVRSRQICATSFMITFVLFALIKTYDAANLFVEQLLSLVTPVQFVRDPSDLMALVVLWPAWLFWKRLEQSDTSNRISRLHFLPLGLAALATAATSCADIPDIRSLAVDNDIIYAYSAYPEEYYASRNGVDWWQTLENLIPDSTLEELQQGVQYPLILCLPNNQEVCYRITGKEQVEETLDGGQTWRIVWKIPFGRRYFMERVVRGGPIGTCKYYLEPGPFDMVMIGNEGSRVLFASGQEGVLIKNEDGSFSRHPLLLATPTPYSEFNLFLISGEILGVLTLSLFIVLLSSYLGWNMLLKQSRIDSRSLETGKWSLWLTIVVNGMVIYGIYYYLFCFASEELSPLFGILVAVGMSSLWNLIFRRYFRKGNIRLLRTILLVLMIAAIMQALIPSYSFIPFDLTKSGLVWIPFPYLCIFSITMTILTWRHFRHQFDSRMCHRMQNIAWQTGGLSLIPCYLPFILWMLGWIPLYEWAIGVAGVVALITLIWAWLRLRKVEKATQFEIKIE